MHFNGGKDTVDQSALEGNFKYAWLEKNRHRLSLLLQHFFFFSNTSTWVSSVNIRRLILPLFLSDKLDLSSAIGVTFHLASYRLNVCVLDHWSCACRFDWVAPLPTLVARLTGWHWYVLFRQHKVELFTVVRHDLRSSCVSLLCWILMSTLLSLLYYYYNFCTYGFPKAQRTILTSNQALPLRWIDLFS